MVIECPLFVTDSETKNYLGDTFIAKQHLNRLRRTIELEIIGPDHFVSPNCLLTRCMRYVQPAYMEVLLRAGADPNAVEDEGESNPAQKLLACVEDTGDEEVSKLEDFVAMVKMLRAAGGKLPYSVTYDAEDRPVVHHVKSILGVGPHTLGTLATLAIRKRLAVVSGPAPDELTLAMSRFCITADREGLVPKTVCEKIKRNHLLLGPNE